MAVRWLIVIVGVALVSWALLTADLRRDTRAIESLVGGTLLVFGLAPSRAHRSHPTTAQPED